ncbi:MAG: class I SAM-dependent methyltransferase [Thalassobaculaceae bacterium]
MAADNGNAADPTDAVRRFYEAYPYPDIEAAQPTRTTILGDAWCAVHHALDGRIGRRIRILFAGGGTGLAMQAIGRAFLQAGVECDFVYADLSEPSAAIARRRALDAGLTGVEYLIRPIEDLTGLNLAPFDYIDFSGVINHVADPSVALDALAGLLAPHGGIGIMAYGRLGRTGIYPMQNALRLLGGSDAPGAGVASMREVLGALPPHNWITKNPHLKYIPTSDDVELADRYLNPNDRAFEISELDALCRRSGLAIRGFVHPFLYDPDPLLATKALRVRASELPPIDRAQLAEWLHGILHIHQFFAVPADREPADMTALLANRDTRLMPSMLGARDFSALARAAGQTVDVAVPYGALKLGVSASFDRSDCLVLARLQDGPTVAELRQHLAEQGVEEAAAEAAIRRVYAFFSRLGALHLRRGV